MNLNLKQTAAALALAFGVAGTAQATCTSGCTPSSSGTNNTINLSNGVTANPTNTTTVAANPVANGGTSSAAANSSLTGGNNTATLTGGNNAATTNATLNGGNSTSSVGNVTGGSSTVGVGVSVNGTNTNDVSVNTAGTVGNVTGGTAIAATGDSTSFATTGASTSGASATVAEGAVQNNTSNNIVFKDTKQDYATPLGSLVINDAQINDICAEGEGRSIGFGISAVGAGAAQFTIGRPVDKSSEIYAECVRAHKENQRQYTMFNAGGIYRYTTFTEWEESAKQDPKSMLPLAADEARAPAALPREKQDAFFLASVPQAPTEPVKATTIVYNKAANGLVPPENCPAERIKYDAKTNTLVCSNGLTR